METQLSKVWESAVGSPFSPVVGKDSQFFVGFTLLSIGLLLAGFFGLNRSIANIPLVGIPASLSVAFGAIYMICAVGVNVVISLPFTFHRTVLNPITMSTINRGEESQPPIFKAVSNSARQLFQLLNCIRFASKVHVQISSEGLRFAVEDSRVMQGIVFLDKALFTTYTCSLPDLEEDADATELPNFQISLSALLETLQIFGAADIANPRFSKSESDSYNSTVRTGRQNAFSNQALGLSAGVCRFSYVELGSPFSIILEEAGVTTTCNLNTYETEDAEEIPFRRDAMQVKIIMQARWLHDALSELSSTSPNRLDLTAYPSAPYLGLSAVGHLGSATVEFSKGRELLETFSVAERWTQSYKFDMIKSAGDAMKLASKVSIRGDEQGVLSLQFMVEVEEKKVSFVDFRLVPFAIGEDDEDDEDEEEKLNGSGDEYSDDGNS